MSRSSWRRRIEPGSFLTASLQRLTQTDRRRWNPGLASCSYRARAANTAHRFFVAKPSGPLWPDCNPEATLLLPPPSFASGRFAAILYSDGRIGSAAAPGPIAFSIFFQKSSPPGNSRFAENRAGSGYALAIRREAGIVASCYPINSKPSTLAAYPSRFSSKQAP